ncbi:MAG: aspartate kinase [Epulopiscium sp. Nuni2H_MBin003]|nr:MAG: aspartate kinase [Epulopiscium sp. Nuni2H_MBin003]
MDLIVQKFGGTSVATHPARLCVISKITKAIEDGFMPIVVVSAMGRLGAPYATDTLLNFVKENAGTMESHEYDLLLSCGEIISAVTIATMLNERGIKAKAFTGGQAGVVTDENHTEAELLYMEPKRLLKAVEEGYVPVVAGFQGVSLDYQITTLGRGGSDTSASILGAGVKAAQIEIYTDVDGIMTADPRVCDKVHIIREISYSEIFQMADSGAKVIHPRAVEYAMKANIPLIIKNTFSEEEGTHILQTTEEIKGEIIRGVAHRTGRVQYTILNSNIDLLDKVAQEHISIDLINIFPTIKVFTINEVNQEKLEALLDKEGCEYSKITHCAKITAIGEKMTGIPGIMARIVRALTSHDINILQTADSLTTITCLISEEEVSKAICALHEEFKI